MPTYVQTIVTVTAVLAALGLFYWMVRQRERRQAPKKSVGIAVAALIIILSGVSFGLASKTPAVPVGQILFVDAIILLAYALLLLFFFIFRRRLDHEKPMTTRRIAFLGIIIGLSSTLMLIGFPIFPAPMDVLKVELSGLIIFMTLLWFDWKTALLVSLATNLIHVFMPSMTAPLIPVLDEGVNVIATVVYMLPVVLFMKHGVEPTRRRILALTIAGVLFATVFMTLYNALINLPLIYNINMPFISVLEIFGVFNVIKWGLVTLAINLTWRRLYALRYLHEAEADQEQAGS